MSLHWASSWGVRGFTLDWHSEINPETFQKLDVSERHRACRGLLPGVVPVDGAEAFPQAGQLIHPPQARPWVALHPAEGRCQNENSVSTTERALRFAYKGESDSKVPHKHSCSAAWRQGFLLANVVCGNLNRYGEKLGKATNCGGKHTLKLPAKWVLH